MQKISMLINAKDKIGYIHPEIYGHFSEHLGRCIYEGIYVGEDSPIPNKNGIRTDIVEALKNIKIPVLRWPGGCFADEYHWKDGIGPKEERKKMVNTNWGGVTEDNSFGTHEFMDLCEQLGCEPMITGNVGSGTVQEMSEWIEYLTFDGVSPMADLRRKNGREKPWKVKYWGIGNENWGCGGSMRPKRYVDEYRHFQGFCKNYSGNELVKIACGPSTADYNWMETMMKNLDTTMTQAIDLHYYSMPIWPAMDSATEFDEKSYYETLGCTNYLDEILTRHTEIMNRYDPDNKIGLIVGEWGCWHQVEPGTNPGFLYQQNTMRDAMLAAGHFNVFNRHCKRVIMANLAQIVNVLQSVILTEGDKMIKTPTYHVFDLYKEHQGGEAIYCYCDEEIVYEAKKLPFISSSASIKDNIMTLTITNNSLDEGVNISCDLCHFNASEASARILTGDAHAYNDFEHPGRVNITSHPVELKENCLCTQLPPCSIISIAII